jgi:hypothetical protein
MVHTGAVAVFGFFNRWTGMRGISAASAME